MARPAAGSRTHCRLGLPLSDVTDPEQELAGMMYGCLRFVEVVAGNVLRGFANGPAERRHSVHDIARGPDLSPANAVSAG